MNVRVVTPPTLIVVGLNDLSSDGDNELTMTQLGWTPLVMPVITEMLEAELVNAAGSAPQLGFTCCAALVTLTVIVQLAAAAIDTLMTLTEVEPAASATFALSVAV